MPKLRCKYSVSLDGVNVLRFQKGDEVTGEVAERANRAGVLDKRTVVKKQAQPVYENKSVEPTEETKADE